MKTLLLILLLVPMMSFGQSKKKQIEALNFSLDSLNIILSTIRTNSAKESKELNNSINNLNKENAILKGNIAEVISSNKKIKNEIKKIENHLDSVTELNSFWSFDTLSEDIVHTCFYYKSHFPYIVKSSFSNIKRKKINEAIRKTSFRVPSIMSGRDYKEYRDCDKGDYNGPRHLVGGSNEPQNFESDIKHIEQGKYLSILMRVSYQMGGNWADGGYNSYNLNLENNLVVTIPNNSTVKNLLTEDIKEYLLKSPMIDIEGNRYPIMSEIERWGIDDLTFFFKNGNLRLIYQNAAHGVWAQILDVPLPKLQKYLNL